VARAHEVFSVLVVFVFIGIYSCSLIFVCVCVFGTLLSWPGFLGTSPTLAVQLLADNTMLQVHSYGCRHIRSDKRINEWKTAGKKVIQKAAVNERQVIIALAGGGLIYFELDDAGQLVELTNQDLGVEIACLDLGEVPAGRIRSPYLVVGTWDKNVQILSLDPNNLLQQLSTMSLPGIAESLLLTSMSHTGAGSGDSEGSAASSSEGLYLIVGLASGVYQRTRIDTSTGALSDTRSRFLGSKPVKLFNVTVQHKKAVLALTTRPWLSYNYQSRHFVTPLSYESLDFASNFQSEQCNEGIVAISGNTLRIISVEKLGDLFNQQSLKLTYTPRRVVTHPNTNYLIAIETDHNEHPEPVRQEIKAAVDNTIRDAGGDPDELNAEGAQVAPTRGPIPQGPGFWGSRITVIDTVDMNVLSYIELENNEAAFSICTCVFKDRGGGEVFVVVGTAKGMTLHPRAHEGGNIHVYRMIEGGRKLIKVHSTQVEDVPLALCQYQGRLMAGVGKTLRIYELGKKKLLKKCENRQFPTFITKVGTHVLSQLPIQVSFFFFFFGYSVHLPFAAVINSPFFSLFHSFSLVSLLSDRGPRRPRVCW
jgi:splicing factor 3B subunit 3